jgi:spermidine synthase
VRSALVFDDKSVTGVEINPLVLHFANDVFGEYTGHLDRDPRVTFVNDEARSYIARTDRNYDIMQISLIDTWAAQGAGAYALTENSLYTTEAWTMFLKPSRVTPASASSASVSSRFVEQSSSNCPPEHELSQ